MRDSSDDNPEVYDDLEADCLTCHRGHGGNDPFFLLPGGESTESLPEPASPADEADS